MGLGVDSSERGSALLFLFIAMALLGALSFMFLHGSRNSVSMLEAEQSDAAATATQDCTNIVNMAVKRLEMRGCGNKVSYLADGTNANAGAPSDGSCSVFHPNGGGAKACNASAIVPFDLTTLLPGETGGGVVYVGIANGKRIYTTPADLPGLYSWNNGTSPAAIATAATNWNNGKLNTDILVGLSNAESPYNAANTCRALGPDWYLPTMPEGYLLATSSTLGDLNGTFIVPAVYWTSVQNGTAGWANWFRAGTNFMSGASAKTGSAYVRCVRSD